MRRAHTHSRFFIVILIVVALPLFGLLLFGNGKKWYERRQQEKSLAALQQEISRLKTEEREKQFLLEKLKSPFFIEKEGREKFGAAKPGENVVVFPAFDDEDSESGERSNKKKTSPPFFQQWFRYFFQWNR